MNILRSRLGLMAAAVAFAAGAAAFSGFVSAADRPDDRVDKVLTLSHASVPHANLSLLAAYDLAAPVDILGNAGPPALRPSAEIVIQLHHFVLPDDTPLRHEAAAYPTGWSPWLQPAFVVEPLADVAPAERYNC